MPMPSEKIKLLLQKLVDDFEKEDSSVRQRQLRTWRKLKLFWEGLQHTWYSEVAHDWRVWDQEVISDDTQQVYYDKPVNVFRAYLESIIAALSIVVPPVKCYPDDAENNLDIQTAKTGDKIAKLLFRHNDANLLWIHALFIFCTEGMTACYTYEDSDEEYGTYEKKNYEDQDETHQYARCPNCGYNLSDQTVNPQTGQPDPQMQAQNDQLSEKLEQEEDKFSPDNDDVPVQDYIAQEGTEYCPVCAQQITPMLVQENLVITRLVGITNEPKTRICMEAYGGLNVKVPTWARNQRDCPYLRLAYETHFTNALEEFEDADGDAIRKHVKDTEGPRSPLNEDWARLSPQYNGEFPQSVVTVSKWWIRPSAFKALDDEDEKVVAKKYPNGVKVCFINDELVEACNEALDDCWTLTYNPLADYVHFDPLGLLLTSIQDITNDIISLTTQTIEHGIGQTFADPETLNFDAYRQLEATPGGVYEAKPKTGKAMGDSFYEVKTATLSGEVLPFFQQVQSLGQLVSGALPSLFGGQMTEGSGTASEYSMSRAQALQRLQNTWKMLTAWWKNVYGKAIPAYMKEVKDDERYVERNKDGSFVNVYIRKAEMEGKIGRVELEANENLPLTWNQRKDVIMQMIQSGVPEVLSILGAPENLPIIREAIGLDDFFVPDEDYVEKCYDDIQQLLQTQPTQDPNTGQDIPIIQPDPVYDNPNVAFEIIRRWVVSEAGRVAKVDNADGYRSVLLLGQMYHQMMVEAQMQQQLAPQPQNPGDKGAAPQEKPAKDTSAPIKGENDVPAVQ